MNIVVAVDKFKGSLTSFDACTQIKTAIKSIYPRHNVAIFPMADGGDGFVEVIKYYQRTQTIRVNTVDPLNRKIKGNYQWDENKKTAYIELAVASGLVLLKTQERNPCITSSYGTGILMNHAIKKGAKKIVLGLGGSATNDGGLGIAAALGFTFFDKYQNELAPEGASMIHVRHIKKPSTIPKIKIEIACDVINPLYGKNGAAFVYGPQKGATPSQVIQLDKGLKALAKVILKETGNDISTLQGLGAAGGVSAMLSAYFNATMVKGIDLVIKNSDILKVLKKANLLITGEGKIDAQSTAGKVVGTLVNIAKTLNLPILLVAGTAEINLKSDLKNIPCITIKDKKTSTKRAMEQAAIILKAKVKAYFDKENQVS